MERIDFAVIGAQKCATSWLYYCLRDHPEIVLPRKKDEADLFGGFRHRERGDAWFDDLYPPKVGATIRGSVSVDYSHDEAAFRTLCTSFPAVKLILSVRDPVERSVSACDFLVRRGQLPLQEPARLIETGLDDFAAGRQTAAAEVVTRSLYGRQLRMVAESGALERLMVVSFDQLARRPEAAIAAIYRFLGVSDPEFVPESIQSHPKRSTGFAFLTRIERLAPGSRALAKAMDLAHRGLSRFGFTRRSAPIEEQILSRYRRVLVDDGVEMRRYLEQIPASRRWTGSEIDALWGLASGG